MILQIVIIEFDFHTQEWDEIPVLDTALEQSLHLYQRTKIRHSYFEHWKFTHPKKNSRIMSKTTWQKVMGSLYNLSPEKYPYLDLLFIRTKFFV